MVENNQPNQTEQITSQYVEAFVKEALVLTTYMIPVCGDGRYGQITETTRSGIIDPTAGCFGDLGEHLGVVAAVIGAYRELELEYDPIEVTNQVIAAAKATCGKFVFHTDSHNQPTHEKEKITGCGHFYGMTSPEHASRYGVDPNEMQQVLVYVRNLASQEDLGVIERVLDAKHREKGILNVTGSTTYTLLHKVYPEEGGEIQFFVVDPDKSAQHRQNIYKQMGLSEKVKAAERIKAQQDQVTLSRLAAGKPVFEINIQGDKKFTVTQLGIVQTDGSVK